MTITYSTDFFIGARPGGISYETYTASGTSPLSLPKAKANSLSSVKAFGGTEQRNLPEGYTQVEYIQSSGTQYIDTGIYVATGYKIRVKAYATDVSNTIAFFGCTSVADSGNAYKGIYRIIGRSINRCAWGNGSGSVVDNLSGNDSANTWYDMVCDNGVWTINDTLFATCPEVSFTSEYSMWLFARNTAGTVGLPSSCGISVCQIWDNNGQMIRNLIPCKNSSNVIGMYDTVSDTFFTNQGTGDFVAGPNAVPTPTTPIDIVCNNGVVKYGQYGKNLMNPSSWMENRAVSTQSSNYGEIISYSNWSVMGYLPLEVGEKYTWSVDTSSARYAFFYNSSDELTSQASIAANTNPFTFTVPSGTKYVYLQISKSGTNLSKVAQMLELGKTATTYEPYHFGLHADGTVETIQDSLNNTATCEDLLSIQTYRDVQSVLDGVITRKIGIMVLDGTENWQTHNTWFWASVFDPLGTDTSARLICTHFKNQGPTNDLSIHRDTADSTYLQISYSSMSTVSDLKTWLAEQYAAGTPVIVVYMKSTPTTETVTGQTLNVQAGDNTLEITQASMTGLELEATYKKVA